MKKRPIIFLIIIFFMALRQASAQDASGGQGEKNCIELKGLAYANNVPTGSYTVTLYEGNSPIKTIPIGNPRIFTFSLKRNSIYSFKISKKGYVDYLVWINTYYPEEDKSCNYKFTNEIYLVKEDPKYDDFWLDFPVAIFEYDADIKSFIFNKGYTEHIKKLMKIDGGGNLFKKQ